MTSTASMLQTLRGMSVPFEQRQAMSALVTDMTFREFLQATFNPYLQTGMRIFPDDSLDPDLADRILDEEWAYFRDDYQSVVEANRPFRSLVETYGKSPAWPVYCCVINKDVPGLMAQTARAMWGDIPILDRPDYDRLEKGALPAFPCYVASARQGSNVEFLIMVRNCIRVTLVSWGGVAMERGVALDAVQTAAEDLPYDAWFRDHAKLQQFAIIPVRLQPSALDGKAREVEVIDVLPGQLLEEGKPTPSYRSRHDALHRLIEVAPPGSVSGMLFYPVTCHIASAKDEFAEIMRMARREFAMEVIAHQPDAAYSGAGAVLVEAI